MTGAGEMRTEHDALGPIDVPRDALYGARTARCLSFSGRRLADYPAFVRALAAVKDQLDHLGLESPIKTGSDEEILALFADIDTGDGHTFITKTIESETDFQKTKDSNIAQAALIEFYKKMFGVEPSKVRKGYAKFDVQNPPLNFTLNQVPFNESGALSHLGIQVATSEDVFAVRDQWQKAGLTTRDEIKTDCCYAVQDKTWVNDPDGNEWEVFVVLEDNLPETDKAVTCCAPAQPVAIQK